MYYHSFQKVMLIEMESLCKNYTRDLVPWLQGENVVNLNGFIRPNLPQKVPLSIIKISFSWKTSLSRKALTTPRHFPLLQRWTLFNLFALLLLTFDGRSIRWIRKEHFYNMNFLNKFTWNNPWFCDRFYSCLSNVEVTIWFEIGPPVLAC